VNFPQAVAILCCFGFLVFVFVAFEVVIFRIACALCRVPQPGFIQTVGLVFTLIVVPAILDAIISAILIRVYEATRYPLWEAGIVQFFLALPIHMSICSFLHSKIISIPIGQALAVWLVEKLMKLALLVVFVGVVAILVLIAPGN
jgi:hypothetical protein